ncbi:arginine and glutamate-rich protein 1-like [Ambystoma mexicanum]|uniref:arginine and glutamate-rich protein 1-like n=1 Tax=Ambystoma mexicanum TaxID=8296 RepID=UPI0037E8372A
MNLESRDNRSQPTHQDKTRISTARKVHKREPKPCAKNTDTNQWEANNNNLKRTRTLEKRIRGRETSKPRRHNNRSRSGYQRRSVSNKDRRKESAYDKQRPDSRRTSYLESITKKTKLDIRKEEPLHSSRETKRSQTTRNKRSTNTRTFKLEKLLAEGGKVILNRKNTLKLLTHIEDLKNIKTDDIDIIEFMDNNHTDRVYLHISSKWVKRRISEARDQLRAMGYDLSPTFSTRITEEGSKDRDERRTYKDSARQQEQERIHIEAPKARNHDRRNKDSNTYRMWKCDDTWDHNNKNRSTYRSRREN